MTFLKTLTSLKENTYIQVGVDRYATEELVEYLEKVKKRYFSPKKVKIDGFCANFERSLRQFRTFCVFGDYEQCIFLFCVSFLFSTTFENYLVSLLIEK